MSKLQQIVLRFMDGYGAGALWLNGCWFYRDDVERSQDVAALIAREQVRRIRFAEVR